MNGLSFVIKKLVASLVLPPFGFVLLVLIGLMLQRKYRRLGTGLIIVSLLAITALSTSFVSSHLLASLQNAPALDPNMPPKADAIVVLGGGLRKNAKEYGGVNQLNAFTLERLRYGAWLAKRTRLPILVSGGALFEGASEAEVMANTLRDEYGLEARWVESRSLDTHGNATESALLLRASGISRILLVTHAWHMRRAFSDFKSVKLDPIAAPTSFARLDGGLEYRSFLPDGKYYYHSTLALHEWLGVVWGNISTR